MHIDAFRSTWNFLLHVWIWSRETWKKFSFFTCPYSHVADGTNAHVTRVNIHTCNTVEKVNVHMSLLTLDTWQIFPPDSCPYWDVAYWMVSILHMVLGTLGAILKFSFHSFQLDTSSDFENFLSHFSKLAHGILCKFFILNVSKAARGKLCKFVSKLWLYWHVVYWIPLLLTRVLNYT